MSSTILSQLTSIDIIEIIKLSHYWILDIEKDCLIDLMETIPNNIINHYTEYHTDLYRGLITKSNESIYNDIYCSWTTDKDTAQSFREKESIHEMFHAEIEEYDQNAHIIDSLYYKSDYGFNLQLFISDLVDYIYFINDSEQYELYESIESEITEVLSCECLSDALDILLDFQHEKEIISSFDINSVTLLDYLIS